jgi:hypothetical protein
MTSECPTGEHFWYRPSAAEGVRCRVCDLRADEVILGMRADEAVCSQVGSAQHSDGDDAPMQTGEAQEP